MNRLRDPLIQVWMLVLLAFGCGIWGHYRAVKAGGHHKNPAPESAVRLLLAGASLEWTDRFGPGGGDGFRPELVFRAEGAVSGRGEAGEGPELPDLRQAMRAASARGWRVLTKEVRDRVCGLPAGAGAERRVVICWSGSEAGNAKLLRHMHAKRARMADEPLPHLVVGNGSWSSDGAVEWMYGDGEGEAGPVVICLIGRTGEVTPAQTDALGEVLNFLEARRGHLVWEVHRPAVPQLAAAGRAGRG